MTELEIMIRAKQYIDLLAKGINPRTGENVGETDVVNDPNVIRCLYYVSGVLQKVIDNGGEVASKAAKKKKRSELPDFDLTDEQKSALIPKATQQSVSRIAASINELIDSEKMKKLKASTISDWLVSIGMLKSVEQSNGKHRKVPTNEGIYLGMHEKEFVDGSGVVQLYTAYDTTAQQFIFDNLDSVIEFAKQEKSAKEQ